MNALARMVTLRELVDIKIIGNVGQNNLKSYYLDSIQQNVLAISKFPVSIYKLSSTYLEDITWRRAPCLRKNYSKKEINSTGGSGDFKLQKQRYTKQIFTNNDNWYTVIVTIGS